MQYLIKLKGNDKDPIHSGDMRSWFYFYKWVPEVDNEVFFPIAEDAFPEAKEGDTLCFSIDDEFIGSVVLLRVVQDDMNDRRELWYNCKDIKVPISDEITLKETTCVQNYLL